MAEKTKARCPRCQEMVTLSKVGRIRKHRDLGEVCVTSGALYRLVPDNDSHEGKA